MEINIMKYIVTTALIVLISGCVTQGGAKDFDALSALCESNDYQACFDASDIIWNLRSTSLKACEGNKRLCIVKGEDSNSSMVRISDVGIKYNKLVCDKTENNEACLRAGSSLSIKASQLPVDSYKPTAKDAEHYFDKGCSLGSKVACIMKGSSYRAGT